MGMPMKNPQSWLGIAHEELVGITSLIGNQLVGVQYVRAC